MDERTPGRDTRLESQGAEFLVLGSLLAEGIPAWKAYTNFPGYDIVAGNIAKGRICRIQVKSRFAIGATRFPIKNFDCDFVCFVMLNRERRGGWRTDDEGRPPPEIYVLPKRVAKNVWEATGWGGISLGRISNVQRYLNAWHLVSDFLKKPRRR